MSAFAHDNGFLPEHIGIQWEEVASGRASARLTVAKSHMAPNNYLHAASIIGLADSVCGLGCMASRPEGAVSFTTIELKSNFLGSARQGETIRADGRLVHGGRTTQVWDAEVVNEAGGKTIALFRCTQMLIYPQDMTGDLREMFMGFLKGPYANGGGHPRALGFEFVSVEPDRGVLKLPYRTELAGDVASGVIAGGAVTALLDHVGGLAVLSGMDKPGFTATLDLRIDYQRPAEPGRDLYAEAHCYKRTRTIAFVRAHAWDDTPEHPVATAQATFVLTGGEGASA